MEQSLLDQLIAECSSDQATERIFAVVTALGDYGGFCDAFCRRAVHEYAAGRLSFVAANRAVNRLYAFSYVIEDRGMPGDAWDVYLAFDAGEYRHAGDTGEVDPKIKYTRPAIREIIARDRQ